MNDIKPPPVPNKTRDLNWKWMLLIIIGSIFILVILLLMVREYVIQAFKIPAGSMKPTLLIGDHILCDKIINAKDIRRGDIIVFRYPKDKKKDFVKRVVGIPGDSIEIKQKQLIINGHYIEEDYVIYVKESIHDQHDIFGPVTVPANSFFVLGDNRDNSYDSRHWGHVDYDDIKGKVTIIYCSWDSPNSRVRWERIGRAVGSPIKRPSSSKKTTPLQEKTVLLTEGIG